MNNHNKLFYRVKHDNFEMFTYAFEWNTAKKIENDLIPWKSKKNGANSENCENDTNDASEQAVIEIDMTLSHALLRSSYCERTCYFINY